MDLATYSVEDALESSHWWFVTRRKLFAQIIERLGISTDARVLDIGTSTGTNLRMLADLGFRSFRGLDISEAAAAYCAKKGFPDVTVGDVNRIPFADGSFDFVLATDILEHVDEDFKAAQEIRRVLRAGGRALITVPTTPSLWGLQDDVSQHKRRYRLYGLVARLEDAGFVVEDAYHFNYLLFLPIWFARQAIRILKPPIESENQVNTALTNRILKTIFSVDVATAHRLRLPFGVSGLAIVRRPAD